MIEADFLKKFLSPLKWTKRTENRTRVFLGFHKILSLLFARSKKEMEEPTILCFPVNTSYLGKFFLTKYTPRWTRSNQIAGFFDHQYLGKEFISIFEFFRGDTHSEKVASEATFFGWIFSDMSSHIQIFVALL